MQVAEKENIGRSTTPVLHPLDAHLRGRISCRGRAVSPLRTSGNFLSHRSALISPEGAPLTTIRMEIATRPALIPAKGCMWISMLQLQVILLTAEPAIDVIPNVAKVLPLPRLSSAILRDF